MRFEFLKQTVTVFAQMGRFNPRRGVLLIISYFKSFIDDL